MKADELGEWDGEGFDLKPLKKPKADEISEWYEKARTDDADKMAHMWAKYVHWKKFWCNDKTVTLEDFASYMRFFYQYDILY